MATPEQMKGKIFQAQARPFAEFDLLSGQDRILNLRYVFSAEVENCGGIAYQCECNTKRWELQFFRSALLQRESYRVLCDDVPVLKTNVLRIFRSVDITHSDGLVWHCRTGIFGTVVRDSKGLRMLQSSPRLGMILGMSSIRIDGSADQERILPILIILLHLTTHHSQ